MESNKKPVALYVVNLVLAIVAIFSCAVYSKLTGESSTGFVFLGIALLAYAILLFVANNMKKKTLATVLRIILNSALMGSLFIFAIVAISIFAAGGQNFDIFEMFYALFGLIAFAFSILNFVYCLVNLRNNASESYYKLFNWCLFGALAAILITYVAQGLFLSIANFYLLTFHGMITLAELLFTFFLVGLTCKNKAEESEQLEPKEEKAEELEVVEPQAENTQE